MTGFDPLEVPLKSDPGKPPLLAKGWGHISMSHCSNAQLIGWFSERIGVDIERKDRNFQANKLSKRFFTQYENIEIENLSLNQYKEQILNKWVVKEAAIKWHHGKISKDISEWTWENNSSYAYNKKLGFEVKVYNQNYKKWTYAIVLNRDSAINKPIICIN